MRTRDFYSSSTTEEWKILARDLVTWLDKSFPSSSDSARVFRLPEPITLANGQMCSVIAISHSLVRQNDMLIRGMSIVLSQSLRKTGFCDLWYEVFFTQQAHIGHVVKSVHSELNGRWQVACENVYSDSTLTEPWKFETMLGEVNDLLAQVIGKNGTRIPSDHPLLNRYELGQVRFEG